MFTPRALLARAGVRPKKRFGQNFLINASAARRVAHLSLLDAPPGARTIEIGAGTGALTHALLAEGARLTALEIDPELIDILASRDDLAGVTILHGDALQFDFAAWAGGDPWIAVGNLPYNVATAVLLRLIEMDDGPATITATIQTDVAKRLSAQPGSPAYGSLSVAVQYAMRVEMLLALAPQSFYPAPKVRSSVVKLARRDEPAVHPLDRGLFWKVVRGAFAYRRKTLANSLALALQCDRATIERALELSQLSVELRGERLDLSDFARLADQLAKE